MKTGLIVLLLSTIANTIFDPAFLRPQTAAAVTPATYSNLEAWWKADSLSLTNSAPVGGTGIEWQDESSNNRDGTQGTAGARPLFKTSIFGSMPAIRFDGSDDTLAFTPDISKGANDDYSVLIVGKSLNSTDGELLGHSVTNIQVRVNRSAGPTVSFFGNSIEAISDAFSNSLTNVHLITWRTDGTADTTSFRENKTARGSGLGTGNSELKLNRIARTSFGGFANWDIAEIVVYSRRLTDAEVDNLYDNYFKTRWGLP